MGSLKTIAALCALVSCNGLAASGEVDLTHLTLPAAETLFRSHSHELAAARQAVQASDADRIAAAQLPNPSLSAGVSSLIPHTGWGPGTLRDKQVDSVIGLSQLFERGNKRALRTEAAENNLEASRNDLLDGLRQQTLALRDAFYDLLLAQERLRISEETAALMRRSVDAALLRAKKGDIAAADVARLRVDALRAENDLRQAQGDRDKARVALSYFLGVEADVERIHAETAWPNAIELPASLALEAVISSRADVLAAARRLRAAQNNWDLARAARTRDVTVGVQYEHWPGDVTNNTYGITFSVPLFLFYQFDGEIKKAHVAVLSAEEDLMRIRDLARAELLRAQSDLASAQERLRRYSESLLHEAEVAAAGAEYAYRRGAVGVTDLLDARRILYATRLDAITAQADYAKALAAWQAATQIVGSP